MPNLTNIKIWIQALESGEYEQTTGALRHGDGFCCLGVACDQYLQTEELGGWADEIVDGYPFIDANEFEADGELPQGVAEWLDVDANPRLGGLGAMILNDRLEQNFGEIAAAARAEFGIAPEDLPLGPKAAIDPRTAPLKGPKIEGMARLDWLGQSLTDEMIAEQARSSHARVDVDAVIRITEGAIPDNVETVGDWIDGIADRVARNEADS